jgi:hypothetical protein
MTHRISKWVSHSARENWRAKWAEKLFGQWCPGLTARGDAVTPVLARARCPSSPRLLMAEHGTERVLDVRRPKAAGRSDGSRWSPGALLGSGALLLLRPRTEPGGAGGRCYPCAHAEAARQVAAQRLGAAVRRLPVQRRR